MRRAFVWAVAAYATLAPPMAAAAEITELALLALLAELDRISRHAHFATTDP